MMSLQVGHCKIKGYCVSGYCLLLPLHYAMGVPARFRTESLAQCHRIVGFRVFFALPHDNFCHAGMAKIVTPTVFVELRQKLSAIGIGAASCLAGPLPHHPACGSAPGG
ncbi:hypothetical protein ACEN88_31580, partial [Massilia sp. CT11-108]|uniref:hypothetical protein n=1 Tax=Massilia sp. CT11-108 TaxID=3393900 RepID=UPI0039A43FE7